MSGQIAMSRQEAVSGGRSISQRLALLLVTSLSLVAGGVWAAGGPDARPLVVGSKNFTEGVVLGELARALASSETPAEHRQGTEAGAAVGEQRLEHRLEHRRAAAGTSPG